MSLKAFELRKAIWAHLDAELSLDVYSHVPQNADFPYVRIGPISSVSANTKSHLMRAYTVTVNVFDKDQNSTQSVDDGLHDVAEAMERRPFDLDMAGAHVVEVELEYEQTIQQGTPTDHYYNGVQRYRILVMED